MKKYILILITTAMGIYGQNTLIYNSSGGSLTNHEISLEYSIGELNTSSYISPINFQNIICGILLPVHKTLLDVQDSTYLNVQIYPNPTSDHVTINGIKNYFPVLYNMEGFEIALSLQNHTLDFSNVESGSYILKIYNTSYQLVNTSKVIKH